MGEDVFFLLTETGGNWQILILKHLGDLPEDPSLWIHLLPFGMLLFIFIVFYWLLTTYTGLL